MAMFSSSSPPQLALNLAGCCHLWLIHISALLQLASRSQTSIRFAVFRKCMRKTQIAFGNECNIVVKHRRQNQSTAKRADKDKSQNVLESKDANTSAHNVKTWKPSFARPESLCVEAVFCSFSTPVRSPQTCATDCCGYQSTPFIAPRDHVSGLDFLGEGLCKGEGRRGDTKERFSKCSCKALAGRFFSNLFLFFSCSSNQSTKVETS